MMCNTNMAKIYNLEQKVEFLTCFFCDKTLIPKLSISERQMYCVSMSELLGDFTKLEAYKIGKKHICRSCKNEIWSMVQDEDY